MSRKNWAGQEGETRFEEEGRRKKTHLADLFRRRLLEGLCRRRGGERVAHWRRGVFRDGNVELSRSIGGRGGCVGEGGVALATRRRTRYLRRSVLLPGRPGSTVVRRQDGRRRNRSQRGSVRRRGRIGKSSTAPNSTNGRTRRSSLLPPVLLLQLLLVYIPSALPTVHSLPARRVVGVGDVGG
jgi:hypothetical protein